MSGAVAQESVVAGVGPAPMPRPRRGRAGRYSAIYARAERLRAGEWLRVVGTASLDEADRAKCVEAIRKGLAGRGVADMLRCYIDTAGNIIVANKGTES